MAREAPILRLSTEELHQLHRITHARSSAQALVFRARLVLRWAQPDKPTNLQVAAEFACEPDTVSKWRGRFHRHRLDGLRDLPRSGRPPDFSPRRSTSGRRAGDHQAR